MTSQDVNPLVVNQETLPLYRFPEPASRALGHVYRYTKWRNAPLGIMPNMDVDLATARGICEQAQQRGDEWLSPEDVTSLLQAFGLSTVPGKTVQTADEAVKAVREFGYPVAVKMVSSTLVHKTEWQGVKLNLEDDEAVKEACDDIAECLANAGQAKALEGFLVQPMIKDGVEVMMGVTSDPLFGPLIGFGLGGTMVEVLRDMVFRITPLTDVDAQEMIQEIKGYALLKGFRGAPPVDIESLQDSLLRISRLVAECPTILELDLNPVRAREQGCVVLDARVRISRT
jgi:acyl-CoA synthetase (NDP forming)